jgi:hypothetical protein
MAALMLVLVAVPLQLLGYTGTCTMGDDKAAVSGALFSGLPLLIAALFSARLWRRREAGSMFQFLTAASAIVVIGLTSGIWLNAIRFGTPCGMEYQSYDAAFDTADALILVSYLFLPLLIAFLARPWSLRRWRMNAERRLP